MEFQLLEHIRLMMYIKHQIQSFTVVVKLQSLQHLLSKRKYQYLSTHLDYCNSSEIKTSINGKILMNEASLRV